MANRAAQLRTENAGLPVLRRGRHFLEFDLGGNQRKWIGAIEPLHYGALNDQEIDAAFVPDTGAWQWKMVANSFQLHTRDYLNAGDVLNWLDVDSGENVTVQPLALNWVDNVTDSRQQIALPQAVQATAADNLLTWTNGFRQYGSGRHFKYTSHPRQLIKHLIIDAAANLPAPTVSNPYLEIEFILKKSAGCTYYVDGVAWDNSTKTTTANRIEVRRNTTGEVLWFFDSPSATDAEGNVCAGLLQLRRQGANRYCTVRVPKTWVDTAVFPIALDPTITLQPDATNGLDAWISSYNPTSNYGTNTSVAIGQDAGASEEIYRQLIKFDLTTVPDTFDTAKLYLFCWGQGGTNSATFAVYRQKRAWVEAQATWNIYSTGNNWSTAGGFHTDDCEQTDIGSRAFTASETLNEFKVFNLTPTTKTALDLGNGWLIKAVTEIDDSYYFRSSDYGTAGERPYLEVVYTEAGGGGGALLPRPGTLSLMGVGR